MYLRFTIYRRHDVSRSRLGIFQAAFELRDSGELEDYEQQQIEQDLNWFKKHMRSPPILRDAGTERALSWFKAEAKRPIRYARSIVLVLEEHDYLVNMVKSVEPGRIVYEDQWQVVAFPPRDKKQF